MHQEKIFLKYFEEKYSQILFAKYLLLFYYWIKSS